MVRAHEDFEDDIDFAEDALVSDLSEWRRVPASPLIAASVHIEQSRPPC
jgi:hypothetical protein